MKHKILNVIFVIIVSVSIFAAVTIERKFELVAKPMIEILELEDVDITFIEMTDSMQIEHPNTIGLTMTAIYNSFDIYIKRNDNEHTIDEIIAHELIHVYQGYNGRVISISDTIVIWNGYDFINTNEVPYSFLPWEIEARFYSKLLLNKFNK